MVSMIPLIQMSGFVSEFEAADLRVARAQIRDAIRSLGPVTSHQLVGLVRRSKWTAGSSVALSRNAFS